MLQEKEPIELETNRILPNIYTTCETSCMTPKEVSSPSTNEVYDVRHTEPKSLKSKEVEVVPHIPEQVTSPQPQLLTTDNNEFPKSTDVPHVLQPCQNFDLRYQRELIKSAFMLNLNLNSDGCLNQPISGEDATFRLACARYMESYHQNHQHNSHESEEQAAVRRARNALRMRHYRQHLQGLETPEQAAERRAQNALRMRNYRRFKRELEPELAAERRAQNAERMRNYRKVIRELKPETAALLRAQNALRMRNYRKNRLQKEPE